MERLMQAEGPGERLGGDPPCWEHLLDDEGNLIEPGQPPTAADDAGGAPGGPRRSETGGQRP